MFHLVGWIGILVTTVLLVNGFSRGININRHHSSVSSVLKQKAVSIPVDSSVWTNKEKDDLTVVDRDAWVKELDYDGFAKEVKALGQELKNDMGEEDVQHLNKIVEWRNIAAILGIGTMWASPNPLTIIALSTWTYASWTMVAHHTCHGGYNRVDAGNYNSRGFALGKVTKRIKDWCDWMLPEAWNVEHNNRHHYHLGETQDPDLVERNLEFLREMKDVPLLVRYGIASALIPIWKWYYYAPNTYKELQISKFSGELPSNFDPEEALTVLNMMVPQTETGKILREMGLVQPKNFFFQVLAPFLLTRFILLPAPLLLLPNVGMTCFTNALTSLVVAECLTNLHAFITIVTNHAGSDLYKFKDSVKPNTGSFYVRQIVSSANYSAGTDRIDFLHGWLNYQIEHHVWPDLSMLQYQKGAPKLKALCEKYRVPYIQENVWIRLIKTMDIMVGKTSMMEFPTHLEPSSDKSSNSK